MSSSLISVDEISSLALPKDVLEILLDCIHATTDSNYLNLFSKNITDDLIPGLCKWIIKLGVKVNALDMSNNKITSYGASLLFDTLKTAGSTISYVNVSFNQGINDEGMKSLGEYIQSSKSIQEINIAENLINDQGIEILAPYFRGNVSVKRLHLNQNQQITNKSIPFLMAMVETSLIEKLNLTGTSITNINLFAIPTLCNSVKSGCSVFHLRKVGIKDDNLVTVCEYMKKYNIDHLKEIDVKSNKITSKGVSLLLNTLRECSPAVTKLDISMNEIDDECMNDLGKYLEDNEHLKELILGSTKITDKGIKILSECLSGNSTLERLYLDDCQRLTDASFPYFEDMAKTSGIILIRIWYTGLSLEVVQKILHALKTPLHKRALPIKSKAKSAAKITTISASSIDQ